MGFLSKITGKIAKKKGDKRGKKQGSRHHSHRQEYLLNENTPFNVTEAFRSLKAALSVSVAKKSGGRVIMVTSAYPEDGKTTVTTNLALMFANSAAKVLLLDADIRKGRVFAYFKEKSTPGLSDFLSGQNTLEEVVRPSKVNPNLSYIAGGTHSPKAYELLESEGLKNLLSELASRYDYVIIDTPPVLVISDALALVPAVDGTVLVCRHQVSYLNDVSRALSTLEFAKANVLGVVVNDYVAPATNKYYGNYKKYSYYNYYGYGSDESKDMATEEVAEIALSADAQAVEETPVAEPEQSVPQA